MSPTLLELIVAMVLIFLAWQIGLQLAPRVLAALISFWRNSKPPFQPDRWPPEKNITPPPVPDDTPPVTHVQPRR